MSFLFYFFFISTLTRNTLTHTISIYYNMLLYVRARTHTDAQMFFQTGDVSRTLVSARFFFTVCLRGISQSPLRRYFIIIIYFFPGFYLFPRACLTQEYTPNSNRFTPYLHSAGTLSLSRSLCMMCNMYTRYYYRRRVPSSHLRSRPRTPFVFLIGGLYVADTTAAR